LMGRAAALRGLNPWSSLCAAFAGASLLMLAVNLAFGAGLPGGASQPADLFWLGRSVAGWGMLLLMAGGPTLLGYGMYNVSLKHLPSSVVNLLLTLEPACTALMAFLIFGERLGVWQLAGSLLILTGVLLLRLKPAK
ncbi:MAG: DMT family transporter, partial [Ignavibacteriales bacterium]|nr:DMT family transporter [Ignavibacteriales bacterium]